MGSNGLISKGKSKVEGTSLSIFFEKMCPIYMSYGMSYDEFWYKSPYRAKYYLDSYKRKVKQQDEYMWMQGMYIYEALCRVSPILHAFSKKGTKVLVEPITGATLEFNSDGECKGENCTITVDMNGEKGPNEFWTQEDLPKDKMKFIIKRNDNDEITVITPEFIR